MDSSTWPQYFSKNLGLECRVATCQPSLVFTFFANQFISRPCRSRLRRAIVALFGSSCDFLGRQPATETCPNE